MACEFLTVLTYFTICSEHYLFKMLPCATYVQTILNKTEEKPSTSFALFSREFRNSLCPSRYGGSAREYCVLNVFNNLRSEILQAESLGQLKAMIGFSLF